MKNLARVQITAPRDRILHCHVVIAMVFSRASLECREGWRLSPLTLAILAGMALGNAVRPEALERIHPGLRFCQQKLLRLGIVLYGVRLTLADVAKLAPTGAGRWMSS